RREVVSVGLDLELGAARAHVFHHLEEERMHHRLAAREGHVRHFLVEHLLEHGEDLLAGELVAKRLAGPALLDAVQAGEVALVGDLPRHVERCAEIAGLGRRRCFSRGRRGACRRGRRRIHRQSSASPLARSSAMNASASFSIACPGSLNRCLRRRTISDAAWPAAISCTTAVATGLSVNTFSLRVSKSTPPNFSSRNFTYLASLMGRIPCATRIF